MPDDKRVDVLAIAAHPDDVEMGCGGTVAKLDKMGYSVGILNLTNGEIGTRGTKNIRNEEAKIAMNILNVKFLTILDLGDGHLMNDESNRKTVVQEIRLSKPKVVMVSHQFDDHPDHVQCASLVKDAVYLSGVQNYVRDSEYHRVKGLIYYMCRGEFHPTFIVDITDEFDRKMEAIKAYGSQFYKKDSKEPQTALSDPEFLNIFETRGRYYGRMIGCRYGEPFFAKYPPKIIDPVALF